MAHSSDLRKSAEQFLDRLGKPGDVLDKESLLSLRQHEGANVPDWLVELLTELPLGGVQVGVAADDLEMPLFFEIGDAALIEEINVDSYPGEYLFPRGYVALGCGAAWAGDIFVVATSSDDPPVYQVWHDVSDDPEELEQAILEGKPGTRRLAASLSELFLNAVIEED